MKKGFTLIEIVFSLTLIIIIGTITIIGFKKNDNDDKIYSTVENSITTYLEMNESIKKEIENNYGVKVFYIKELREQGLLNDSIISKKHNVDIEKIENHDKLIVLSTPNEYNELGFYYIVYPYKQQNPYFVEIEPIYILKEEYEDKEGDIKTQNIYFNKIKYFNEDYNSLSLDVFNEFENNDKYKSINLEEYDITREKEEDKIKESYKNKDTAKIDFERNIYLSNYILKYSVLTNNNERINLTNDDEIWINKTGKLKIEYDFDVDKYCKNNILKINNEVTNEIDISKDENTYSIHSECTSFYDNTTIKDIELTINKDEEPPTIETEIENNKFIIKIKDNKYINNYKIKTDNSSLKEETNLKNINEIIINDLDINNEDSVTVEAIDKAGNITTKTFVTPKITNINVTPIKDSFSKFEITINNFHKFDNINLELNTSESIKNFPTINSDSKNAFIDEYLEHCKNHEGKFEIDLLDLLKASMYKSNGYRNYPSSDNYNDFVTSIQNFSIDLKFILEDNEFKYSITIPLKIQFDSTVKISNEFFENDNISLDVVVLFDNGDFVFKREKLYDSGAGSNNLYYYNFKNNSTITLFEGYAYKYLYIPTDFIHVTGLTNNSVLYKVERKDMTVYQNPTYNSNIDTSYELFTCSYNITNQNKTCSSRTVYNNINITDFKNNYYVDIVKNKKVEDELRTIRNYMCDVYEELKEKCRNCSCSINFSNNYINYIFGKTYEVNEKQNVFYYSDVNNSKDISPKYFYKFVYDKTPTVGEITTNIITKN